MNRIAAVLLATLAAPAASPLAAQEWQVARQEFAYVGNRLTIHVDVETPGTLRLIRGEPGTVHVAGRARDGFTSAGLSDDDRLTLSAAGAGPVDYLVAVPENVFVNVRLPDRPARTVARGQAGTWEWDEATRSSRPEPAPEWVAGVGAEGGLEPSLYTTFSRDLAPEEVSVPDLGVVTRVSVRVEGYRFRVITSRPLGVSEGNDRNLVIRPAGPPMDVVLALPRSTPRFVLRLGGATALLLDAGAVTTFCTPVTEQRLSQDRRWFTFNPLDGALDCTADAVRRHGG